MPFYEYECSNCKFYVETLQKISDEPLRKCPSCKKQTLKKLISAPVFRLKGAGWYETDFKSEGEDKRNLADREEATEKPAEDKAATDTKADAKADAAEKKKADAKPEVKTGAAAKKAPAKAAPSKSKKPVAKAPTKRPPPKKSAPAKKKAKRR
jgi:putative FmdB family regulatory protein